MCRPAAALAAAVIALAAGPAAAQIGGAKYEQKEGLFVKNGPVSAQGGPVAQMMGRGFMMGLKTQGCAADPTCYEPIQQNLGVMGCESFVLYKHLNTMGGVCFIAAADTLDAKRQLLATYFKIRQQGGIATAAMDARVQLNPINPDMVWAKGLFGGGRWGRRRQPKPAPGPAPVPPPAPLPPQTGPAPTPPEPGPNGGGNPATTPDPNVYNWGLDRANQQNRPMDKNNLQCPSRGAGVVVFVLDTGCRTSHQEIRGRATTESVVVETGNAPFGAGNDGHGHGTHCAGTAAGVNVGIAPGATIRCIKVLDDSGSGSLSNVVAGLNTVAAYQKANPGKRVVCSLSLGAAYNQLVNDAVSALVNTGVVPVVAAGNSNIDAANASPASVAAAITVGASGTTDAKESYSNWGNVVDIYAPGGNIYSAAHTGDSLYKTMSGTSMATPGVAGAVACIMAADLSATCASPTTFVNKLSSPSVTVNQGWRQVNKPLLFIPSNSQARCP